MTLDEAFTATLLVAGSRPHNFEELGNSWRLVARHTLFTATECNKITSPFVRNTEFERSWKEFVKWLDQKQK